MTLGQKLRQARLSRGMTQKALAGERITRNMLSQIENDQAMPSMRTLEYLAAVLGVNTGWLLSQENDGSEADRLTRAKAMYRTGQYAPCLELLRENEAQAGDEELLLLTLTALKLARQALENEQLDRAEEYSRLALAWNERGLYASDAHRSPALEILARVCMAAGKEADAAIESYRQAHLQGQSGAEYHLVLARYHLQIEHIPAAEREIWSISELPDAYQAEYLLLRGKVAMQKEQYENARLYLRQAEQIKGLPKLLQRELYHCMELCGKELEDYPSAYEYAAKQLNL